MTDADLSDIERKAIAFLASGRGRTCNEVGEHLWGEQGYHGSACSCPFARPAGRLLHKLKRLGKATQIFGKDRVLWF